MLTSGCNIRWRRIVHGLDFVEIRTTLARQIANEVNLWIAEPHHATVPFLSHVSRKRHAYDYNHAQLDLYIAEYIMGQIRTFRTRLVVRWLNIVTDLASSFCTGIVHVMEEFLVVNIGLHILLNLANSKGVI
jgi:hypothetical protein